MGYSKLTYCGLLTLLLYVNISAQNTVGLLSNNTDKVLEGYTLLYPLQQSNVYLIDNCGEVVHEWVDSSFYRPGISAYLLDNGNLLKTKRPEAFIPGSFSNGGAGAIVELVSWDNDLIWSKKIVDSTFRMHHDVEIMPNGNVLIIVWQRRSKEEYIEEGGNIELFNLNEIWPDIIQEYDPILDSIVWEWDSWNHIVQDFDSSKNNFGDVASSPGKIDLNYDLGGFGGRPDWIHSNAIDYNQELDQILLSASHFEEMWIIDHSTTTEEAKGDTGGQFGKGGQLLFRWGNPRAYKKGDLDDKQLFFQHDVHWIDDPNLSNSSYYQQIGLFNNRIESDKSSINIVKPVLDNVNNEYVTQSGSYLPLTFSETILSSEENQFQSSNMSSMQLLPNGNFLACAAQRGKVIEMTPEGQVIWEYKLPFRNGVRISQGTNLNIGDNVVFRAKRYDISYGAFNGKILEPKYFLELDPNLDFCDPSLNTIESTTSKFKLYPNPAVDVLNIQNDIISIEEISVYNSLGVKIDQISNINRNEFSLQTAKYSKGLYYIILNNTNIYKVLVIN